MAEQRQKAKVGLLGTGARCRVAQVALPTSALTAHLRGPRSAKSAEHIACLAHSAGRAGHA
eukprot:10694276-Alexandrium_andersonii.AAC.1